MGLFSMMIVAGMAIEPGTVAGGEAGKGDGRFSHTVFFTLADPSDVNRQRLVTACKRYLSGHDGERNFMVGTRADEMQRDVNVRNFDVSLQIVFESKAAHDQYQAHPRHLKFVEENQSLWNGVRVFDSHLH